MIGANAMELWQPKKNNCLAWVLVMRLKFGGVIIPTGSHYGWWPHFYWSPDGRRRFEFAPPRHVEGLKFPPLLFRGRPQEVLSETITRTVKVCGRVKTVTICKR